DELGCDLGEAFGAALCPANLDCDGATFDPTKFAQSLHKSIGPLPLGRGRGRAQVPDGRQLAWLLRARCEWPRCRAADQRYELAPFHCAVPPVLVTRRIAHLDTARDCCAAAFQSGLGPVGVLCHEYRRSKRRCVTVREMKVGPSRSAIRC